MSQFHMFLKKERENIQSRWLLQHDLWDVQGRCGGGGLWIISCNKLNYLEHTDTNEPVEKQNIGEYKTVIV